MHERWDYVVVKATIDQRARILSERGRTGWELVSVQTIPTPGTQFNHTYELYFKRRSDDPAP